MNILLDIVPQHVEIDGYKYPINSDFRISIMFELLMQETAVTDQERVELALNLYYPEKRPYNITEGVNKILWFYRCGDNGSGATKCGSSEVLTPQAIYSFEHDAEYIYAAFLDQYGIDLQDIEYLHWWKFRAMFKGLKEDNLISQIMRYRAIQITDDMSDAEKSYYRKMKQIYALPDNRSLEEKERDFEHLMSRMF